MRLDLKSAWNTQEKEKVNESKEFQNIRDLWNGHDSGDRPWTKINMVGAFTVAARSVTTTYAISDLDNLILADSSSAAFTVTLPDSTGLLGRHYTVINTGTKIVTIATTSPQTINGGTTFALPAQYFSVTLYSDGTNWLAI